MLVHLGLISFETEETNPAVPNDRDRAGEGSESMQLGSRVQKDFESEDGSIYGYEGQVASNLINQESICLI